MLPPITNPASHHGINHVASQATPRCHRNPSHRFVPIKLVYSGKNGIKPHKQEVNSPFEHVGSHEQGGLAVGKFCVYVHAWFLASPPKNETLIEVNKLIDWKVLGSAKSNSCIAESQIAFSEVPNYN